VVGVNAAFAIVRVLLSGTPGCLVHKHIENKAVLIEIKTLKVVVQICTVYETVRNEVILNAFVLEVKIDVRYSLKIFQSEVRKFIRLLATVKSNN